MAISELEKLLIENIVEIDSPDGYIPVENFIDKGLWEEYILTTRNDIVRVNENHLFETSTGWEFAKDIVNLQTNFLTREGYIPGIVTKTGNIIPIVDITVDHPNHRYYTSTVSSHNTGVGKSLFLCHLASAYYAMGHNVLYITMELSEEKVGERIDANLLDIGLDQIETIPLDSFNKKINRIKSKVTGKLIVKEYAPGSCSAANFRYLINELKLKQNFHPDIVMIDYLNICASSRLKRANSNSYEYLKSVAEELRGIGVDLNIPIWTAIQTNRAGSVNSDFGMEDTAESFGIPQTLDFYLALISNEELYKLNQILIKQLKSRYDDLNRKPKFVIGIDRMKMRLYDLEESAQESLDHGDVPIMDSTDFSDNSGGFQKFLG